MNARISFDKRGLVGESYDLNNYAEHTEFVTRIVTLTSSRTSFNVTFFETTATEYDENGKVVLHGL